MVRISKVKVVLAAVLVIAAIVISIVSYGQGLLTNVLEYVTLVISGTVVVMLATAGALLYKSIEKNKLAPVPVVPEAPTLPSIHGTIVNVMIGQMKNPENPSETLTSYLLFVSLTNATRTPASVRDYEMYVDVGSGFERMKALRGINDQQAFHFEYHGRELDIPNFNQRLLPRQTKPIEFGLPFEGFLWFAGDGKYYKPGRSDTGTYKVVVVDVFGQRHEIVTESKDFMDLPYIAERFGVKGFWKSA